VHALSADNGEDLGRKPSSRIYTAATWRAKDLRAGGKRYRLGLDVELSNLVRDSLAEPGDFANYVEEHDLVERLRARAMELGREDLAKMIDMYIAEEEDQIPVVFGVRPNSRARNSLSQRFYRGVRRLLQGL